VAAPEWSCWAVSNRTVQYAAALRGRQSVVRRVSTGRHEPFCP
jgi:hypothetical protein